MSDFRESGCEVDSPPNLLPSWKTLFWNLCPEFLRLWSQKTIPSIFAVVVQRTWNQRHAKYTHKRMPDVMFQGAVALFWVGYSRTLPISKRPVSQWPWWREKCSLEWQCICIGFGNSTWASFFSMLITELVSRADGRSRVSLEGATWNLQFHFWDVLFWDSASS